MGNVNCFCGKKDDSEEHFVLNSAHKELVPSSAPSSVINAGRNSSRGSFSTHHKKRIMFLGAPGVGKGTYASRIAGPILDIPTISTGDLVREEIKNNTKLGQEIQKYSDKGLLVPDEVVIAMVTKRLKKDDVQNGYLLDGFPRNVEQAKKFAKLETLDMVVNISLPEWILIEKILGRRVCSSCGAGYNVANIEHSDYQMPPLLPKVEGICDHCGSTDELSQRKDDTEKVIRDRIKIYRNETFPLISFYEKLGILRNFEVKKGLADLDHLVNIIQE